MMILAMTDLAKTALTYGQIIFIALITVAAISAAASLKISRIRNLAIALVLTGTLIYMFKPWTYFIPLDPIIQTASGRSIADPDIVKWNQTHLNLGWLFVAYITTIGPLMIYSLARIIKQPGTKPKPRQTLATSFKIRD